MELLQLRYFAKVARMEHMTRAAEELRIAQPALSKTIARLEEHVGVPLFDRYGGRIRLNTFGSAFLGRVEQALALLDEGKKELSELAGMEQGSIHLATATLDRLSEPIGEFLGLHPEVNFQITQASTDELTELIDSGGVDICFTALPFDGPGISARTVLTEEIYLAVPNGHRLAGRASIRLSEVSEEPFIGYKEGFIFQQMNEAILRQAGVSPKFVCRVDEPKAVISLVRAGLGVALFGCRRGEETGMTLISIDEPLCRRHFQIIWQEKRYLSLAARKFRDFLIGYFAP